MIIIDNIYELEKEKKLIDKIFKYSENFEFTYHNLYALHNAYETTITFIDEKNNFVTSFMKKNDEIYECCMDIEPIYIGKDKNKIIDFVNIIYEYLNKRTLYFPLIYENSNFLKIINNNETFIKYKRLYTSIVELSKFSDDIFDTIEGSTYLSKKHINQFKKVSYIKNIKGEDVTNIIMQVEKKSWKYKVGQDMISHKDKLIYYSQLIKDKLAEIFVAFDKEKNNAIAYRIDAIINKNVIQLKTSFDEEYKKYSPGVYISTYEAINYYKTKRYKSLDLHGGPNLVKTIVETKRINRYDVCYVNIDIINELKNNRENWDMKNYSNFLENKAIRKIYKGSK